MNNPKYIGGFKHHINTFEQNYDDVYNKYTYKAVDIFDFIKCMFKNNFYFKEFTFIDEYKPLYYLVLLKK